MTGEAVTQNSCGQNKAQYFQHRCATSPRTATGRKVGKCQGRGRPANPRVQRRWWKRGHPPNRIISNPPKTSAKCCWGDHRRGHRRSLPSAQGPGPRREQLIHSRLPGLGAFCSEAERPRHYLQVEGAEKAHSHGASTLRELEPCTPFPSCCSHSANMRLRAPTSHRCLPSCPSAEYLLPTTQTALPGPSAARTGRQPTTLRQEGWGLIGLSSQITTARS